MIPRFRCFLVPLLNSAFVIEPVFFFFVCLFSLFSVVGELKSRRCLKLTELSDFKGTVCLRFGISPLGWWGLKTGGTWRTNQSRSRPRLKPAMPIAEMFLHYYFLKYLPKHWPFIWHKTTKQALSERKLINSDRFRWFGVRFILINSDWGLNGSKRPGCQINDSVLFPRPVCEMN